MLRRLLRLSVIGVYLVSAARATPQIPSITAPAASPSTAAPPPSQPPAPPPDPLGRSTPRGMLREFVRAVDRDDYVSAARYMQLSNAQRPHAAQLARQIRELLNCCFDQPLATISDVDTGALDDGLPLDQERIGPLKIGSHRADIILVHVSRPEGSIWLISSMTLEEIPALHGFITESSVERFMPQSLQKHIIFGLSLAHWIVWSASLLIPLLGFLLLSHAIIWGLGKTARSDPRRQFLHQFAKKLRWPVVLILAIAGHLIWLPHLGFPLRFRIVDKHLWGIALVVLLTMVLRRSVTLLFDRTRIQLLRSDRRHPASMLLLGERLLKVVLIIAAVFAILTLAGVDTKTALAGLGIGGIAIAFGAQKTIENLLGAVLLISDKAISVGDFCSISDRLGTIEDITLRSVRMRTLEQTVLSIPAGSLSQANIENFRTRTKMLLNLTLRLEYSATRAQLSAIRDAIYKLVTEHVLLEASTARVNLIDFGLSSFEMQVWAYILTADAFKFNATRQEVLLQIVRIVESAGCRFALPSQTVYSGSRTA